MQEFIVFNKINKCEINILHWELFREYGVNTWTMNNFVTGANYYYSI